MPDPRLVLALAAQAQCDVRTARAYLGGRRPRGHLLGVRLDDGARSLGVERASAPPSSPPAPAACAA